MKCAFRFAILGVASVLAALALTGCATHREDFAFLREDVVSTPGTANPQSGAATGPLLAKRDHTPGVRALVSSTVSAGFHDVYMGRTGSTSITKLNSVSGDYNAIILSRDGSMVAFTADDAETGYSHVFVASVDDVDNPTQLTTGSGFEYGLPTFSPDGTTIAANRVNDVLEFALIDIATKDITPVMPAGFDQVLFPNITSDNHLVFQGRATEDDYPAIWMSDIDGSNPVKLTNLDDLSYDWGPSLSANGQTIAFFRLGEAGADIYTIPITGESESVSPNQLTFSGHNDSLVFLNRDIVFASRMDNFDTTNLPDIYSMRSDGNGLDRLTDSQYNFLYLFD